jgi:2-oxoisovalerate dehydrogenase E2 component (dihydrolipoyl transacylase)
VEVGSASEDRPTAEACKVKELTLTFDHRVFDGCTAAGVLSFVDAIDNGNALLAHL